MFSKKIVLVALLALSSPAFAASTFRSDGTTALVKSILENMGRSVLRGLVVDAQGRVSRVVFHENDAVEVKRGLWILKAGDYESEI